MHSLELENLEEIEENAQTAEVVRIYQRGQWICELKRTKHEKEKYVLNIKNSTGEKLGYLAFYVIKDQNRVSFAGIYVHPSFRSNGISKAFLEELSLLASEMELEFAQTKPQYKPITCALLVRSGFAPYNGFPEKNRVFVGRTELEGYIGVHFENPARRAQFESSRLYKGQPYLTCSRDDLQKAQQIVLGTSYRK